MVPPANNLWRDSPRWRLLVCAAVLGTVLIYLAKPWRAAFDVGVGSAHFNPTPVSPTVAPMAGSTPSPDPTSDGAFSTPEPAPAAPAQSVYQPPSSSTVTWSNRTGNVTGGGLIAAHCCAGASTAVYANSSVTSGKHYWELTLSTEPGRDHPSTYTTAGVAIADEASKTSSDYVRAFAGVGANGTNNYVVAIRWGEDKRYQNGDVFMFALDAARGQLAYGVNGRWLNGDPQASSGDVLPPSAMGYIAFAGLSSAHGAPEGDRWIANFGATRFRYAVPDGYGPYGAEQSKRTVDSRAISRSPTAFPSARIPPPNADPDSLIGKLFQNEVTVGGQSVPLPEGTWTGLAFFRGSPGSAQGDALVLARIERGRAQQFVAINGFRHAGTTHAGFPRFAACDRKDYLFAEKSSNEPFGEQKCWWINHNDADIWKQPIFRAAQEVLNGSSTAAPSVLLNVAIHRANTGGFVTAFYFFDPTTAGFVSAERSWANSEWTRDRVAADPQRAKYVDELKEWGKTWTPIVYAYRGEANRRPTD